MSYTQEVTAGMALLDQYHNDGNEDHVHDPSWAFTLLRDIQANALNMGSEDNCVLGLLFDGYENGLDALFGSISSFGLSVAHGFMLDESKMSWVRGRKEYAILTDTWVTQIHAYCGWTDRERYLSLCPSD